MRRTSRMRALTGAAVLAACGSSVSVGVSSAPNTHVYQGAASVGDLLTITVDRGAHTLDYVDHTNGDSGTVSYVDLPDGGMDVTDPNGDLLLCYDAPGTALVCSGAKLGPSGSAQPALVYAIERATLTKEDIKNKSVGHLDFRTREGGIEVGHMVFDANGNGLGEGYFPIDLVLPEGAYGKALYEHSLTMAAADMSANAALGTVDWTEPGHGVSHIAGTPSGNFMIDSPNGARFTFRDAPSKDFSAANAGTYTALVYSKAVSYLPTAEVGGSLQIRTVTVTVGTDGAITAADGATTLFSALLLPFEGSDWQGTGKITSPMHGLFYFLHADSAQVGFATPPVFVTFFDHALAFAEFDPGSIGDPSTQTTAEYVYSYGIAVKL